MNGFFYRSFSTLPVLSLLVIASFACRKKSTYEDYNRILTAEVDRICDSLLENSDLPGMVVGIWSGEKGFSYIKGKGLSNLHTGEAIKTEDLFRVGSNTKTFVVTAVLQLADEGKLSLEDHLSKYFPDFPKSSKVTLRMLCDMTSGIPNYTATPAFEQAIEQYPRKEWTPEELVDLVKNEPYLFEPGTNVSYSNTNTTFLGMILEKMERKKLEDILNDRLIKPLGLRNTYLASGHLLPANSIHGYMNMTDTLSYTDDVSATYDLSWAWAAGGMVSNLEDIKTWVEALVDGTFLSSDLQKQRFTSAYSMNQNMYGLGMFTMGGNMWGHNGGLPGYTSIMMHHRTRKITMVLFFNWQHPNIKPDGLYKRLLHVVHPELG